MLAGAHAFDGLCDGQDEHIVASHIPVDVSNDTLVVEFLEQDVCTGYKTRATSVSEQG